MKRNAFDEARDQRIADDVSRDFLPCMRCGGSTPKSVLAHLGARCSACFEAFCLDPVREKPTDTLAHRTMRKALRAYQARMTGDLPSEAA